MLGRRSYKESITPRGSPQKPNSQPQSQSPAKSPSSPTNNGNFPNNTNNTNTQSPVVSRRIAEPMGIVVPQEHVAAHGPEALDREMGRRQSADSISTWVAKKMVIYNSTATRATN